MATNETAENTGVGQATDDASTEMVDLQADIELTRANLADTVDQLTAKLDVKTRLRNRVADTKDNATSQLHTLQDRATDDNGKPTPATLGIGGGVLAALVATLLIALWRRNGRR